MNSCLTGLFDSNLFWGGEKILQAKFLQYIASISLTLPARNKKGDYTYNFHLGLLFKNSK